MRPIAGVPPFCQPYEMARLSLQVAHGRLKLILAGLLVSVTPATLAAPPPPTLGQVPRPILTEFARCVAKLHHREAADYVLRTASSWTPAGVSARRKLADARCIPAGTDRRDERALLSRDDLDQLRPPLAEALVRQDLPAFDASHIGTAQPSASGKLVDQLWPAGACKSCKPAQLKKIEQARARSSALMAPLIFAECVARTDPASVHTLLMSEAGSLEESATVPGLRPALEQCVVQGAQFKVVLTELRMALALSYYRLAHAPRLLTQP